MHGFKPGVKEVVWLRKIMRVVLLAVLMIVVTRPAAGAQTRVGQASVWLDGNKLDMPALIEGSSVSLPVRCVFEALGYDVAWSDQGGQRTITLTRDGSAAALDLQLQKITVDGHVVNARAAAGDGLFISEGTAYIDSSLLETLFSVGVSYDASNAQVSLFRRNENKITVRPKVILSDIKYLVASIQYPQLSGLADQDVMETVNGKLEAAAQEARMTGEQNAAKMAEAIRDGYTGAVGNCETFFDYLVTYNQHDLFSVVLTEYQYSGGAHGATVQHAFAFDLATGKALKLGDLMQEGSGWTGYIDGVIRREIDRRAEAGILSEFQHGKFDGIGAAPDFYLDHDAVVIYFREYEYFPYVAGIQEFRIPYGELGGLLRRDL
jgi:inhibitor of cysteine peptidase